MIQAAATCKRAHRELTQRPSDEQYQQPPKRSADKPTRVGKYLLVDCVLGDLNVGEIVCVLPEVHQAAHATALHTIACEQEDAMPEELSECKVMALDYEALSVKLQFLDDPDVEEERCCLNMWKIVQRLAAAQSASAGAEHSSDAVLPE